MESTHPFSPFLIILYNSNLSRKDYLDNWEGFLFFAGCEYIFAM